MSNYLYRKSITIPHANVSGGSDLVSFPLLISLTDTDLKTVGNGGKVQSASGYDLIFVDSTHTLQLDHEIELYAGASGQIVMWVRVPLLSASVDTVIYLYFGNAGISTSQENAAGVWDAYYAGVWHFPNGTTLSANDSTANTNNGTNSNGTAGAGQIDGAVVLNGTNAAITLIDQAVDKFVNGDSISMEVWAKRSGTGGWSPFLTRRSGSQANYEFGFAGSGLAASTNSLIFVYRNSSDTSWEAYATSATFTNTTTWHRYDVAYTYGTAASAVLYVDGAAQTASWTDDTGAVAPATPAVTPLIGTDNSGAYAPLSMDELRLSKGIRRSAGWIGTGSANQSSPSTFTTVGITRAYVPVTGDGGGGVYT